MNTQGNIAVCVCLDEMFGIFGLHIEILIHVLQSHGGNSSTFL